MRVFTLRNKVRQTVVAAALAALVLPFGVSASGGGGGFSGGGGFGGGTTQRQPRVVDETYEYGKAVFLGREPGSRKIDYCVLVDGEPQKLKRKTLKAYKGATRTEFANALYDCDNKDELALRSVDQQQIPFVIYYLDKRYKLKLGRS